MTTSDHKKALVQLKVRPVKVKKYLKHNAPIKRRCGIALYSCRRCGRHGAQVAGTVFVNLQQVLVSRNIIEEKNVKRSISKRIIQDE